MNVIHCLTALIGIPLKGKIDLELPNGSKEEALRYMHDPFLLGAMNPLISDNQPNASSFRRMENRAPYIQMPEVKLLTVNEPPEGAFASLTYKIRHGFGSATPVFEMVAKDLSPTVVEVRTRGTCSLRMIETYTLFDDRVERKVRVPRSWFTTNMCVNEGLWWNTGVWSWGPEGPKWNESAPESENRLVKEVKEAAKETQTEENREEVAGEKATKVKTH